MPKKLFFLLFIICFSLIQSAYAKSYLDQKCSESIINLVGHHFTACKVWPKNNSITIAAFHGGDSLGVALVDNNKGKVISTYQEEINDAPMAGQVDVWIDTARYDLAPGIRAFGVDVIRFNPGCAEGGFGPARTLFVMDGEKIRPILENLYMSYWSFVEGGISCQGGDSAIEEIKFTISISKAATNGYANLLITAISNGAKAKRKPFQYELHYDGKKYLIDGMEKEFRKWE